MVRQLRAGKMGDFVREYTTLVSLLVTSVLSLAAWLVVRYGFDVVVEEAWAWFVAAWLVNQTAYNVQKAAATKKLS